MRVRVFMSAVVATALFGSSAMAAEPSHIRYDNYTMCAAYMQEQVQGRADSSFGFPRRFRKMLTDEIDDLVQGHPTVLGGVSQGM